MIYFLEDKYCKPIVIQTATTNGAVNVVIPAYIPIICIPVDRSMDKVAQTVLLKVRFPRAILQSTPLYPSNPALNVERQKGSPNRVNCLYPGIDKDTDQEK